MEETNPLLLKANEYNLLKKEEKDLENKLKPIKDELDIVRTKINNIFKSCTHTRNGKSTSESVGQDPGSGRSEHRCTICYKYTKC